MGLFDIFKKKQQPALGLPPLPLDIPPADEAAEFAGNIPPPPPRDTESKRPQFPTIEGKISVSSELPPLPPLPPVSSAEAPEEKPEALLDDIELPSPSEIGESRHEEALLEEHDEHAEPELPTFPELPKELPEEKLFEPEQPPADDLGIPTELPSIDVPMHWPTPLRHADLPDHPFVFLHTPSFKEVIAAIDDVKDRARQSAKSEALIALKNKEDSALNQLQGTLESIQRKLLYVDAALFEKMEV